MSYYPKKGMYRDDNGVARFKAPGLDPGVPTKRFYTVERTIKVLNSKGEVVRKSRQSTEVFAHEADAIGMAMRRMPYPWPGQEAGGEIKENIYVRAGV